MTACELRREYYRQNPDGHFFDKDTMAGFGDTMLNYGVKDAGAFWELYRKEPVVCRISGKTSQSSYFFHKESFCVFYAVAPKL